MNTENRSENWGSLVSEAQFAQELVLLGLRNLCKVPVMDGKPTPGDQSYADQTRFSVHVGLHAFTSGLERFAKLTLACFQRCTTDLGFSEAFDKKHNLKDLLNKVEQLDFSRLSGKENVPRPTPPLSQGTLDLLNRFAGGSGRYEYLDNLGMGDKTPEMYIQWCSAARRLAVPDHVKRLSVLRTQMEIVIPHVGERIDALTQPLIEVLLEDQIDYKSTALVLRLYVETRWVVGVLGKISSYAFWEAPDRPVGGIPLLSEVFPGLLCEEEIALGDSILQLGDTDVLWDVVSELMEEMGDEDPEFREHYFGS